MNPNPTRFMVDYYYQRPGSGTQTRTTFTGSVWQHLHGATTETAVLAYLRHQHFGCEVTLMRLDWV